MTGEEKRDPIDAAAFYRAIRERLEHEDGLIVNRLAWLMASQSFLFTAYAIVLNGVAIGSGGQIGDLQKELLRLLPLAGMASTALIYAGILAAIRAMGWPVGEFRNRVPDEAALGLPPISTPAPIRSFGLAAPAILPAVFLLLWIYLLVAPR